MDWRAYIPHGLFWGAMIGVIVGLSIQPIRKHLARKRMHILANSVRGSLPQSDSFVIPGKHPGHHRKWRIVKPKGHGYYSSIE